MRLRTRVIALSLVAAALAAAILDHFVLSAGAQATDREITVRMKFKGSSYVKHGRGEQLRPGDVLTVRLAMVSPSGVTVGSANTECVNVGRKAAVANATLQCVQTYRFRDGQIVTAGLVKFSALDDLAIPIVGGSGAYRGASGQVTSGAPVKGFDSVDVLQLDG